MYLDRCRNRYRYRYLILQNDHKASLLKYVPEISVAAHGVRCSDGRVKAEVEPRCRANIMGYWETCMVKNGYWNIMIGYCNYLR